MKRTLFTTIFVTILCAGALFAQCPTDCRPAAGDEVVTASDACGSCGTADACGMCDMKDAEPIKKVESPRKHNRATLNVLALDAMIQAKTPLTVIDARVGKFDDGKRLPGAIALNKDTKAEDIQKALPDKAALIVTYCSNPKCQASPQLAEQLKTLGYTNIMELPEGIEGWIAAGKTVSEPKK